MPKTKTDYSKTIMYKIVCNDLNVKDCYVGHTINWIKRKSSHKTSCNNPKKKIIILNYINLLEKMEDGIIGK